jgi:hypothetical protein
MFDMALLSSEGVSPPALHAVALGWIVITTALLARRAAARRGRGAVSDFAALLFRRLAIVRMQAFFSPTRPCQRRAERAAFGGGPKGHR